MSLVPDTIIEYSVILTAWSQIPFITKDELIALAQHFSLYHYAKNGISENDLVGSGIHSLISRNTAAIVKRPSRANIVSVIAYIMAIRVDTVYEILANYRIDTLRLLSTDNISCISTSIGPIGMRRALLFTSVMYLTIDKNVYTKLLTSLRIPYNVSGYINNTLNAVTTTSVIQDVYDTTHNKVLETHNQVLETRSKVNAPSVNIINLKPICLPARIPEKIINHTSGITLNPCIDSTLSCARSIPSVYSTVSNPSPMERIVCVPMVRNVSSTSSISDAPISDARSIVAPNIPSTTIPTTIAQDNSRHVTNEQNKSNIFTTSDGISKVDGTSKVDSTSKVPDGTSKQNITNTTVSSIAVQDNTSTVIRKVNRRVIHKRKAITSNL